ncbi:MAG TPA: TonB-dependent receptor [Kofleriaceae bacterium]|nr:TonB-dependent receptor [Kofleriaceae bacterium]
MATLARLVMVCLASAVVATSAHADPDGPDNSDGKTEVITVTASSPEHTAFTGRVPISVVTRQDLAASGRATLGEILQALPSQANAGNAQVNQGGDGTTRINLRGLGVNRTLVLINGRRMVAGGPGADAAVDVNAIPLAMVERVEILKDGASTTYGADAVGGVVNVITRPQFDGTDVALLTSTSQHGDSTEYDASVVSGFTTDDKDTYLVVSGGYQHHAPVLASDRHFSARERAYDFTARKEAHTLSLSTPAGRLDTTSLGPGAIQPPGCTSTLCKPNAQGTWDNVGPRDVYNDTAQEYLYTPSSRYNVFATGGNRLNAHMTLFVEALYQHRDSSRELSPVAFEANKIISGDSIYNPLGGDIGDYRRRLTELGPRQFIDEVSTLRLVSGVTGTLPDELGFASGWSYELSYNFGKTTERLGTTGQLYLPRVQDALGPSLVVNGTPICVKTPGDPTTQIVYKIFPPGKTELARPPPHIVPCVPLDLLATRIPPDQLKNLAFSDAGNGKDQQGTFLATTSGRIARLPHHGEITASVGADYRNEIGDQAPPSAASVSFGESSTDVGGHATDGKSYLAGGFADLAVVPFTGGDDAVARRLEIDLGARALHDSRFGADLTYKAGALFRAAQGVAARATYATAFRAPSLLERIGGRTEHLPFVEDPCDTAPPSAGGRGKLLDAATQAQCAAQNVPAGSRFGTNQQTSALGGNAELAPETAATATAGVVYEPPQLPGLAVSADYWHIHIDHAIETLSVQTILANCYERGIAAACAQVERDFHTHRILAIGQTLQNVTSTATSGVDLALAYDAALPDRSQLHARFEGQYLIDYDLRTASQTIHGAGFYDLGAFPHLRANLAARWNHPGGASASVDVRYVGSYQECAGDNCNDPRTVATASREVGRYVKVDLVGGYRLPWRLGRADLEVGINNVFNITPPVVYNAPAASSDAATYDFVGRIAFARLEQQF